MAVGRLAEHADIGAGAEYVVLAGLDDDRTHLRMLEAQPLDRIVELNVDREVVGIELELVVRRQAAVRRDVHDQERNVAVRLDPPMAVTAGLGLEVDRCHRVAFGLRAGLMHYYA